MKLKSKFEKGKASRTFQRIDSTYTVNIFVGYDDDGRMTVVITENSKVIVNNCVGITLKYY